MGSHQGCSLPFKFSSIQSFKSTLKQGFHPQQDTLNRLHDSADFYTLNRDFRFLDYFYTLKAWIFRDPLINFSTHADFIA